MKSFFSIVACMTAIVALLFVGAAANASLILNGSFESGQSDDGTGHQYMTLSANTTIGLTDWTVGADAIAFYWRDDAPNAEAGSRWIDFANPVPTSEPYGAVSISQSFSVLAGATYTVTYYEKERANNGNSLIADILFAAGSATGTVSQTAQNESNTWQQFSFSFKPDDTTTATLRFSGGGSLNGGTPAYYGTGLDNADVEQTGPAPEPASLGLLAVGSMMLLRRRNRV